MQQRSLTDFIDIDALENWLHEIDIAIQKIPNTTNNFASWQYALDQVWTLRQRVKWLKDNFRPAENPQQEFHLVA